MDFFNTTMKNSLSLGENLTAMSLNETFTSENFTTTTTNHSLTITTLPIYLTGSVSAAEYQRYSDIFAWIKAICQPICLICLLMSALVFLRKEMRNATTNYLLALNLAEAYYVGLLCIYQVCKLNYPCHNTKGYTYFRFYAVFYLGGMACRRCVYIFNCLVAVQRFLVVAFPMSARQKNILQRSVPVCIAVLLFSIVIHSYVIVQYEVVSNGDDFYYYGPSDLARANPEFFQAFPSSLVYGVVYSPLVVGALASVCMAVSLRRHSSKMSHLTSTKESQGHKERQTNIVVLVSTGLFFFFSLPVSINLGVADSVDTYGTLTQDHYLFHTLLSGFLISSQVVSDLVIFISYITLSSAFRRNVKQILAKLFCFITKSQ